MIPLRGHLLGLLFVASACGGGNAMPREVPPEGDPRTSCVAPSAEALSHDASLADAVGAWRFTLVATGGDAAGAEQQATVAFEEHVGDMRSFVDVRFGEEPVAGVTVPLYGSTDLDLTALGAYEMGGLDSDAPEAPGVQVYEARAGDVTRSITIRLGSAANRRGMQPTDGASTALFVREMRAGGFAGSWRSTSNMGVRAEGYFCAERVSSM